jgi:hypothetical protein
MSKALVSLCGVKWAMEIIGRDNYHKLEAYVPYGKFIFLRPMGF